MLSGALAYANVYVLQHAIVKGRDEVFDSISNDWDKGDFNEWYDFSLQFPIYVLEN